MLDASQIPQRPQAPRTTICEVYNQAQPIITYYDDWSLTGLNIREDHGVQIAAIYEDPAVDTNLKDDGALWLLANGLDNSFLAGRDCETRPTPDDVRRQRHA